ncbi:MAG: ATP-binding protein [Elusimicrobiota bacterium]
MSIKKRLVLFLSLVIVLLLLMGGLLLVGGPVFVSAFRNSLESMNVLNSVRELKTHLSRQRISLNRYLLVDDDQEFRSFNEASVSAEKSLLDIKSRFSKAPPDWYVAIEENFKSSQKISKEVTGYFERGNKSKAYDLATSGLMPQFQKLFEQVANAENQKSREATGMFEKIRRMSGSFEKVVLIGWIIAFLVGLLVFRKLYQSVIEPLSILKKGTEEFGKGHWDHQIDLPYNNEFGALADSFNKMAENVKQLQMQAVHMDRMSAVGQLAGGVAHEINNPLTAVLGQAQILMARLPETDASYAQVVKIEQAALRCKKIVRGLLDFSRPSQTALEQVEINNVILSTLDLCEADFKKSRVIVEKRLGLKLAKIEGNFSELQQVLLNLVNNAIQAMPKGGNLIIESRTHNEQVGKNLVGPWIELRVKDTGIGIPKEHLNKIFEPFFTTKEIGKGTGLGLAVSMGIIKKHGGVLQSESAGVNKGAQFILNLPLKRMSPLSSSIQQGKAL